MTIPDTILPALAGGLMIGVASAIMLLGAGGIAGVSGLFARSLRLSQACGPSGLAIAFILGLPLGALLAQLALGPVQTRFPPLASSLIGGLLVGYGTRLGSGCTSGHGVCGVSRLSKRSLVATGVFMLTGALTVALANEAGLAW
jgi:hypothetical protein